MNKLKLLLDMLSKPTLLKNLIAVGFTGYLAESGWSKSVSLLSPVDKHGQPIPWITLPCIDFLSERLNDGIELLEFGSGNSTLYFAKTAKHVTSIEHDKEWYEKIKSKSANHRVNIFFCPLQYDSDYCRYALILDKKFDLVVVDGRDRVNCVKYSLQNLTEVGCILLDDSERPKYREAIDYLHNIGFKSINFWGVAPGVSFKKCTTVFYKDKNCLGI